MKLISREELKEKLDRGDDFKLVMVLGDWQYRAKHIPGSLNIHLDEECLSKLSPDDEIVVYCTHERCSASPYAWHFLTNNGYKHVRRYAGGMFDWVAAGYPLEGEWVGKGLEEK